MDTKNIGSQVKGLLDGSAAKLKDLQGKGKKVVGDVAVKGHEALAKGQEALAKGQKALKDGGKVLAEGQKALEKGKKALAKGQQKVEHLLSEIRPQDLMERYGKLPLPELFERLHAADMAKHAEALRGEVLAFLKVPTAEQVQRLEVAVVRMNKELAAVKGELKKASTVRKAPVAPKPATVEKKAPVVKKPAKAKK
jgi:hypothetical protein